MSNVLFNHLAVHEISTVCVKSVLKKMVKGFYETWYLKVFGFADYDISFSKFKMDTICRFEITKNGRIFLANYYHLELLKTDIRFVINDFEKP